MKKKFNIRHKPNHKHKEQLRKIKCKLPGIFSTVFTGLTTSGTSLTVLCRRKESID